MIHIIAFMICLDFLNSFTLNQIVAYSLHYITPTFGARLPYCFKEYCQPFVDPIVFILPFDLIFDSFTYFWGLLFIPMHADNIICSYYLVAKSNLGPL